MSNNNARRMCRGISRHTLNPACRVNKPSNILALLNRRFKLLTSFDSLVNSYVQAVRYHLRNCVNSVIRQAHNSADVTNGRPRLQGTEGHNLRNVVGTVFFGYIVDNLLPSFVAEVNIKVGHRHSFRIEKALKNQVVFHRVKVGYSDTVRRKRACAGASAGAYGNIPAFCKSNEILNN